VIRPPKADPDPANRKLSQTAARRLISEGRAN